MADEGRGREVRGEPGAAASRSGSPVVPVLSGDEVTTPSLRSEDILGGGPDGSADVEFERPRAPNAGPVTEDEVTEWIGTVGKSPEAATPPPAAGPASATVPDAEPESASWVGARLAVLIVIAALVIGSVAVVAVRHLTGTQASDAAALRQAAVRGEAAAWVAQQVRPGVTAACDRVMCAALEAHGLPARDLLVLGPLSADPPHSAVVVETAAVRALFGTSLDLAWAPAVLASFGSGSAGITVRVVAPHGAVAYQTALAGDLAARKAAGTRLLADQRISVPATARAQLTAGLVDLRLLSALTTLSRHLPVSLVDFGNIGPGASAGIPFRFADLSQASQVAGLTQAAYVRSVRSDLDGLRTTFRPVRMLPVVLPDGQAVLRVEFTAPSPLQPSGS
jgi:hypothetical protein